MITLKLPYVLLRYLWFIGRDFQGLNKVSMITLFIGEVFERHHSGIFPRYPQKHFSMGCEITDY